MSWVQALSSVSAAARGHRSRLVNVDRLRGGELFEHAARRNPGAGVQAP
jgi:hypothetical protein